MFDKINAIKTLKTGVKLMSVFYNNVTASTQHKQYGVSQTAGAGHKIYSEPSGPN